MFQLLIYLFIEYTGLKPLLHTQTSTYNLHILVYGEKPNIDTQYVKLVKTIDLVISDKLV